MKKGFTAWQIKDLFARCARRFARNGGRELLRLDGFAVANPSATSTPSVGSGLLSQVRLNSPFAFTLAEVLITLAIIGVVAALTIPTVVRDYRERQAISAVKKVYSSIAQAAHTAQAQNGEISSWDVDTPEKMLEILKPYLKVIKNCGTEKGCFPDVQYKYLNGTGWQNIDNFLAAKAILADGTSIAFYKTGTSGYNVWFDINGLKAPNQWGKDLFMVKIALQEGKIHPAFCDDGSGSTSNNCNKSGNGWCCSSWIIKNDNMNYPD